jgi:hypothetical protein
MKYFPHKCSIIRFNNIAEFQLLLDSPPRASSNGTEHFVILSIFKYPRTTKLFPTICIFGSGSLRK